MEKSNTKLDKLNADIDAFAHEVNQVIQAIERKKQKPMPNSVEQTKKTEKRRILKTVETRHITTPDESYRVGKAFTRLANLQNTEKARVDEKELGGLWEKIHKWYMNDMLSDEEYAEKIRIIENILSEKENKSETVVTETKQYVRYRLEQNTDEIALSLIEQQKRENFEAFLHDLRMKISYHLSSTKNNTGSF